MLPVKKSGLRMYAVVSHNVVAFIARQDPQRIGVRPVRPLTAGLHRGETSNAGLSFALPLIFWPSSHIVPRSFRATAPFVRFRLSRKCYVCTAVRLIAEISLDYPRGRRRGGSISRLLSLSPLLLGLSFIIPFFTISCICASRAPSSARCRRG